MLDYNGRVNSQYFIVIPNDNEFVDISSYHAFRLENSTLKYFYDEKVPVRRLNRFKFN